MIKYVASLIVDILIQYQIINRNQVSIYQYGFEILISSVFTFFIVIILGIIFRCMLASLLYFVMFIILRSICGGYHANTYWQCNIIFFLVTSTVLTLFKFLPIGNFSMFHYCTIIFSIIVTVVYAPVENKNKTLTKKQKNIFHIVSIGMTALLSLISCFLLIKFQSSYCILIDITLFVVAISMFITDPKRGSEKI